MSLLGTVRYYDLQGLVQYATVANSPLERGDQIDLFQYAVNRRVLKPALQVPPGSSLREAYLQAQTHHANVHVCDHGALVGIITLCQFRSLGL